MHSQLLLLTTWELSGLVAAAICAVVLLAILLICSCGGNTPPPPVKPSEESAMKPTASSHRTPEPKAPVIKIQIPEPLQQPSSGSSRKGGGHMNKVTLTPPGATCPPVYIPGDDDKTVNLEGLSKA